MIRRQLLGCLAAALLAASCTHPKPQQQGAVVNVTPETFWTAIYNAKDGDTLAFAPGAYPGMSFYRPPPHTTPIVLQGGVGVVTPFISLDGASGWTIKGFEVNGATTSGAALAISNSTNIRVEGSHIHTQGGALTGTGITLRDNVTVVVSGNEFDHLGSGIGSVDDQDVTVEKNALHDIANDGLIMCGARKLTVNANSLIDFYPEEGAHPDGIQWCPTNINPQPLDITITNNRIERGIGEPIQGIFGEQGSNVTIRGNAVLATMYNGYTICGVKNAVLDTNFLQGWVDIGTQMIVRCGTDGLNATNNTTPNLANYTESDGTQNTNWHESGTVIIGPAPVGDRTAYVKWITDQGGVTPPEPPNPPTPDGKLIAFLKAQNARLKAQIAEDTQAFAAIDTIVHRVRPAAAPK